MNVQTELQANRIAQIKVEVADSELEKAKRTAARQLAKRVNIPGFRKGKAPYDIVVRYLGEGAILEEAIDKLGPDLYRSALDEAEIEPYGPGQLENIEGEEQLTFVFNVPLVPTIELGEYRAIRHDYEEPEVTDEMVEEVLKVMQDRRAVIEPKDGPAEDGDQVVLKVYGELVIDDEEAEDADAEDTDADEDAEDGPRNGEVLFDQDNWPTVLGDDDRELMPGFNEAIAGIKAEEERSFELVFPEDDEKYDEALWGKKVNVQVTCKEVSGRHVPAINDDFAQQVEEIEAETLLELRLKIREDLAKNLTERAESEYAEHVLDLMVEEATLEYPEMMIQEYIEDMVKGFEQNLSQQGLKLEDFMKLNQMDEAALHDQYREPAIRRLERSLVLGELVNTEQIDIDNAAIEKEIKVRSERLSNGNEEMQAVLEKFLGEAQSRQNLALDLLTQRAYERLTAIARGEEPPIGPTPVAEDEADEEETQTADETVEATDDAVADESAEADTQSE